MVFNDSTFPRETFTIEELAARLGINRSTAYERARRDELPVPVIRIGRRYLVSRKAYEAMMSAQHEPGSAPTLDDADCSRNRLEQS